MLLVADQEHGEAVAAIAARLGVHLGDERAGCVQRLEVGGAQPVPGTSGATPWAESTSLAPSGTFSSFSTKIAPRRSSSRTTWTLWTICLRT